MYFRILVLVLLAMTLAGCEVIGDIFQAGFAVGIIAVVAVLAVIGFIVAKLR
jgi:hypothetical protein